MAQLITDPLHYLSDLLGKGGECGWWSAGDAVSRVPAAMSSAADDVRGDVRYATLRFVDRSVKMSRKRERRFEKMRRGLLLGHASCRPHRIIVRMVSAHGFTVCFTWLPRSPGVTRHATTLCCHRRTQRLIRRTECVTFFSEVARLINARLASWQGAH